MATGKQAVFSKVSVIVPVTERYDNPVEVYEGYRRGLAGVQAQLEFIYVIDGAYPEVEAALQGLQARGERIRVVKLARSFGEAAALSVGFRYATGDAMLMVPAFHQVQPGELPKLLQALDHADMAVARRWPRSDSSLNRLQTRLFYGVVNLLTRTRFHDLGCNVRAMRRAVCDDVLIYGDQHRFLPILAAHHGFRVVEVDLAQSRQDGYRRVYAPGVYVRRLLDLMTVFFLARFTKRPMRFFGLLGTVTASAGGISLLVLIIQRLAFEMALADRPALLLASLLVVLGMQIFAMGLIGELIIYTHARHLQEYAIEEMIGEEVEPDEGASARAEQHKRTGEPPVPLVGR